MECSTSSTHREAEITQQIHTVDAFAASVSKSLQSIKTTAQQTAKTQGL